MGETRYSVVDRAIVSRLSATRRAVDPPNPKPKEVVFAVPTPITDYPLVSATIRVQVRRQGKANAM
jgi:hypothetical protein